MRIVISILEIELINGNDVKQNASKISGDILKGIQVLCVEFIDFAGNAQQWFGNRTSSRVFRGDRSSTS